MRMCGVSGAEGRGPRAEGRAGRASHSVAQISNLLYRRFPICWRNDSASVPAKALINTSLQRGGTAREMTRNRFSGLPSGPGK
jgi:hypothetical protein